MGIPLSTIGQPFNASSAPTQVSMEILHQTLAFNVQATVLLACSTRPEKLHNALSVSQTSLSTIIRRTVILFVLLVLSLIGVVTLADYAKQEITSILPPRLVSVALPIVHSVSSIYRHTKFNVRHAHLVLFLILYQRIVLLTVVPSTMTGRPKPVCLVNLLLISIVLTAHVNSALQIALNVPSINLAQSKSSVSHVVPVNSLMLTPNSVDLNVKRTTSTATRLNNV